jgi:hypothetical protein
VLRTQPTDLDCWLDASTHLLALLACLALLGKHWVQFVRLLRARALGWGCRRSSLILLHHDCFCTFCDALQVYVIIRQVVHFLHSSSSLLHHDLPALNLPPFSCSNSGLSKCFIVATATSLTTFAFISCWSAIICCTCTWWTQGSCRQLLLLHVEQVLRDNSTRHRQFQLDVER